MDFVILNTDDCWSIPKCFHLLSSSRIMREAIAAANAKITPRIALYDTLMLNTYKKVVYAERYSHTICHVIIPPATKLGGVYWIQRVRPSSGFSIFRTFWIIFLDIEMKLGMIVYNDELQIKFEFRCN
jgi:hypothetical protein